MLRLDRDARAALWAQLIRIIEDYATNVESGGVTPELNPEKIRGLLQPYDFESPVEASQALAFAADNLTKYQTHTPHPRYYGLFNPAPTTMGIAGDALAAAFNPQLAAWSHSPFAVEVEQHVIRAFGSRFGYDPAHTDGTFASGGMEANHTAVLTALMSRHPEFAEQGVRALPAQPVFYASSESHHSFLKAALMCGLGMNSVRLVPVDGKLRMSVEALREMVAADRAAGYAPFCIAATAGTTNAGAIDPLPELADAAGASNLWYHVDAAWGGGAAFVPELKPLLRGIERADSITFDAHKWLSAPMGAGVFLTRHMDILSRTFRVQTAYMPREAAGLDIIDPHLHSMQWSRRFIGLKVFLSLLVAGWEGFAEAIRHQTKMGNVLREKLAADGWEIVNSTRLPVICFAARGESATAQQDIAMKIVASGEAWISTTKIGSRTVLRACITNYRTEESDVAALVETLARARSEWQASNRLHADQSAG
jgi:glutamate/tyrosine decarboxylase-like PLP-dependent enzyme